MKQRNLARLAAFLVGMTGGAALGNDHGGEPLEPCVMHPWWCQAQCAMLNICRSGNTPIGTPDCLSEEHDLRMCSISPEPFSPPYVPPVVGPPVACPAAQHYSGGECQADHECGNDEIGGGSEECEPCGNGKVPNEAGTTCVTCEHGESGSSSGVCAALCSNDELDSAAALSLMGILRNPWEELESYTCEAYGHMRVEWLGSSEGAVDVCRFKGSGPPGSSAYGHSHPYFEYPRDRFVVCRNYRLWTRDAIDEWNEELGTIMSSDDKKIARRVDKPMYLVVPERDLVKVYRKVGQGPWGGDIWRVLEL